MTQVGNMSSMWVTLHCLNRLESLMGEPVFRLWVALQCLSKTTDKLNLCPASELCFSVWAGQNHWQEWLNLCQGCESLFSVWVIMAEPVSSEWVALQYLSRSESLTRWVNLCLVCELLSTVQCLIRSEPLTRICPGSELLFSVWAHQNQ